MAKRKHSDLTEEKMNTMINKLVALNKPRLAEHLRGLIPDLLSAEVRGGVTNAAMDFTFDEVVEVFGLNYTVSLEMEPHHLRIEDSKLDFMMTPGFSKLHVDPSIAQ
jgi:ribosomal protein L5